MVENRKKSMLLIIFLFTLAWTFFTYTTINSLINEIHNASETETVFDEDDNKALSIPISKYNNLKKNQIKGILFRRVSVYFMFILIIVFIYIRKDKYYKLLDDKLLNEGRLNFAVEASTLGLWDWNIKTNQAYFSKVWKSMLGYNDNEISNNFYEWEKRVHPEDLERAKKDLDEMFKKKDSVYKNKHRLKCKDGYYKWILDQGKVIQWSDDGKTPLRVIGTHIDIDKDVKLEEDKLKNKNLESLGFVAGGIAHNLNNLFTIIQGNLDLINTSNIENVEIINSSLKKGEELIQKMLIFAKGGEPIKKECYDFPNFVEKIVIELLENQNISLAFNKTETDFIVYIDENMIRNATVNIISNSIEAFKINNIENREIKCDINIIDYFDKCKYSNHDKHVRIVIMDNAGGINNSVKDKILYPYFTTKSSSLGLGLTIVNSIIEKHEGYLYIDMGEQLKTISNIYIPIKKKVLSKTNKNEPSTQIYSTSNSSLKRILIMDDEEQILKMNKRFLELNGYFVEIALHGKEAIEKYKTAYENNNKFSVVILDLVIPDGMGGEETAVEILKIDKNSKLIVSSGYSNSNALSNFRNYGFISTLPKPYKLDELLDIINVVNNEEIL